MGDPGKLRDIQNMLCRIGDHFTENQPGFVIDRVFQCFPGHLLQKNGMDSQLCQIMQQIDRPAVQAASGNNLIPVFANCKDCRADRRHAAAAADCSGPAFQFVNLSFQRGDRRIPDACIGVAHTFMMKYTLKFFHTVIPESADLRYRRQNLSVHGRNVGFPVKQSGIELHLKTSSRHTLLTIVMKNPAAVCAASGSS